MGFFDSMRDLAGAAADMAASKTEDLVSAAEQRLDEHEASRELERTFRKTHQYGSIAIDANNRLMKVKACVPAGKKSGLRKFGEASAAVMTMGMSLAITSQLGKPKDAVVRFDDVRGFELLEDDSVVQQHASRTGAVGARIGNVGFGSIDAYGASATGRTIDSLILRIDVNSLDTPALFITYISKRTQRTGRKYQEAITECHQAMQCLGMILDGEC